MKIIATLVTHNNESILDEWLSHYSNRVSEVIATVHSSSDATRDILNNHPLVTQIIDEPGSGFLQELWVTRMARIASRNSPDWIIHCDSDELWCNLESLKDIGEEYDAAVTMDWRNHLPTSAADCRMSEMPKFVEDTGSSPLHPVKYHGEVYSTARKILHRPNPDIIIGPGNHTIRNWDLRIGLSQIEIDHYPIRGLNQFKQKVLAGMKGFDMASQPNHVGVHWYEWYDSYKCGQLEEIFKRIQK